MARLRIPTNPAANHCIPREVSLTRVTRFVLPDCCTCDSSLARQGQLNKNPPLRGEWNTLISAFRRPTQISRPKITLESSNSAAICRFLRFQQTHVSAYHSSLKHSAFVHKMDGPIDGHYHPLQDSGFSSLSRFSNCSRPNHPGISGNAAAPSRLNLK